MMYIKNEIFMIPEPLSSPFDGGTPSLNFPSDAVRRRGGRGGGF